MNVSLSIDPDNSPVAEVLTIDSAGEYRGRQFITVRLGLDVSMILPGFGPDSVAFAREFAAALNDAADRVTDMAPAPPPPRFEVEL